MDDLIFIQEDDGTERAVTDEAECVALLASARLVEAETVGDGTTRNVYLNASREAAMRAEWDATTWHNDAAQRDALDRTVRVTIDDGVMQKTEEEIELQTVPGVLELATVKTRMVAQRGIANPDHVAVETLADFKVRQP